MPGGGTDKVIAQTNYVLPDNVENLEIWGAYAGVGNSLDNRIIGNGELNQLEGRGGNDVLSGGAGSDVFIFGPGSGRDVINDFKAGNVDDADIIRLAGLNAFKSFDSVRGAMSQSGADVQLRLSASDVVTFKNSNLADFTASNFQLPLDTSRLQQTFSEEFNTLNLWTGEGSGGVWKTWYGGGSYKTNLDNRTLRGNGELQIYADPQLKGTGTTPLGINPLHIDDGVLTITATNTTAAAKDALWGYDYTSGALTTRGTWNQTYGYFEARLQLPDEKGAWPAFWLMPTDGSWPPEIDIMEAYGTEQAVQTLHTKETGAHTQSYTKTFVDGATGGMHTYGLLWTEDSLTWYIDGAAVKTAETPDDMHKPFYMMVNLAISPGTSGPLLSEYKIDYIRAFTLSEAHATPGQPNAGNDDLAGDAGHNQVQGGPGADTIRGGSGNDHLFGQSPNGGADGADLIYGENGSDYIQGNAGDDTLEGGEGSDRINGGANDDLIRGGEGNDSANGNLGNDVIYSDIGNDLLRGGQGNDTLDGGSGNDTLSGDLGGDSLTGGAGMDVFLFPATSSSLASPDMVADFQDGTDRLSIGYLPTAVLTGGPQASFSAAAALAQQLFDGHAGGGEAAVIAVGADNFLFYASNGGATIDSAINLASIAPSQITAADFL